MTQTLHRTDHELKTAITDELAWTPSVSADRIGVSVDAGAVILSGQVDTYPEKEAAARAAMRVRGVTAIADDIVVKNGWAPREDADIAREAAEALDRMVYFSAGSVQAKVHHHVITLTGSVGWEYQREATRRMMAGLRGVVGVVNMITLKPKIAIVPSDAEEKITAAFVRNARFDARHVKVAVKGSEVELTGTVSSWSEFRQAAHTAWSTPGVTEVSNRLVVVA